MSEDSQDPILEEERKAAERAAEQGLGYPEPPGDPVDPPDEVDYPVEGE